MPELPSAVEQSLAGKTIAIAETRELQLFASLLERRGATVLRYPLVSIVDAPDPAPVLVWLRAVAAGQCDDLIFLTGEGLRRLCACASRHDPPLLSGFVQALARARKITRGPKPARALRELGLSSDIEARSPTTEGIIDTMQQLDLYDRNIGVQTYGSEPNLPLQDFLRAAGARVFPVAPYRYAEASDSGRVRELLQQLAAGAVDAIAFTSKAQVERLFKTADAADVQAALARTQVAAIGPVVAQTLREYGITPAAMPETSWFLKPLTQELSRTLTG